MSSNSHLASDNRLESYPDRVGFNAVAGSTVVQKVNGATISTAHEATATFPNLLDINGASIQSNSITELEEISVTPIGPLTSSSLGYQYSTVATDYTLTFPVVSTLVVGFAFYFVNASPTAFVTLNSSGGNLLGPVGVVPPVTSCHITCVKITGTDATGWYVALHSSGGGTVDSVSVAAPLNDFIENSGSSNNVVLSYTDNALPFAYGGTNVTALPTTYSNSNYAAWDAVGNTTFNNTASRAGTVSTSATIRSIQLNAASPRFTYISGTDAGYKVFLPYTGSQTVFAGQTGANKAVNGQEYVFLLASTIPSTGVDIYSFNGTTLNTISATETINFQPVGVTPQPYIRRNSTVTLVIILPNPAQTIGVENFSGNFFQIFNSAVSGTVDIQYPSGTVIQSLAFGNQVIATTDLVSWSFSAPGPLPTAYPSTPFLVQTIHPSSTFKYVHYDGTSQRFITQYRPNSGSVAQVLASNGSTIAPTYQSLDSPALLNIINAGLTTDSTFYDNLATFINNTPGGAVTNFVNSIQTDITSASSFYTQISNYLTSNPGTIPSFKGVVSFDVLSELNAFIDVNQQEGDITLNYSGLLPIAHGGTAVDELPRIWSDDPNVFSLDFPGLIAYQKFAAWDIKGNMLSNRTANASVTFNALAEVYLPVGYRNKMQMFSNAVQNMIFPSTMVEDYTVYLPDTSAVHFWANPPYQWFGPGHWGAEKGDRWTFTNRSLLFNVHIKTLNMAIPFVPMILPVNVITYDEDVNVYKVGGPLVEEIQLPSPIGKAGKTITILNPGGDSPFLSVIISGIILTILVPLPEFFRISFRSNGAVWVPSGLLPITGFEVGPVPEHVITVLPGCTVTLQCSGQAVGGNFRDDWDIIESYDQKGTTGQILSVTATDSTPTFVDVSSLVSTKYIVGDGIVDSDTPSAEVGGVLTLTAKTQDNSTVLVGALVATTEPGTSTPGVPSFRTLELGDLDFAEYNGSVNTLVARDENGIMAAINTFNALQGVDQSNIALAAYPMSFASRKTQRIRSSTTSVGIINLPDVTHDMFETNTWGETVTGVSVLGMSYDIHNASNYTWTVSTFTDALGTTAGTQVLSLAPQSIATFTIVADVTNTPASWKFDVTPAPGANQYLLQSNGEDASPSYEVTYSDTPVAGALVQYDSHAQVSAVNSTYEDILYTDSSVDIQLHPSTATNLASTITPRIVLIRDSETTNTGSIILPYTIPTHTATYIGGDAQAAAIGTSWLIVNRQPRPLDIYTFNYSDLNLVGPVYARGHYLTTIPASSEFVGSNKECAASCLFTVVNDTTSTGTIYDQEQNWTYNISDDRTDISQSLNLTATYSITHGAPFQYRFTTASVRLVKLPSVTDLARGQSYTIHHESVKQATLTSHSNTIVIQTSTGISLYNLKPECSVTLTTTSNTVETSWVVNNTSSLYQTIAEYSNITWNPTFGGALESPTPTTYNLQNGSYEVRVLEVDDNGANIRTITTCIGTMEVNVYASTTSQQLQLVLPVTSSSKSGVIVPVTIMQGTIAGATPAFTSHVIPMTITPSSTIGTMAMNFTGVDGGNDTWMFNFSYTTVLY